MKIQTIVVSAAFISLALAITGTLMYSAHCLWRLGNRFPAACTAMLAIGLALFTLSCFL